MVAKSLIFIYKILSKDNKTFPFIPFNPAFLRRIHNKVFPLPSLLSNYFSEEYGKTIFIMRINIFLKKTGNPHALRISRFFSRSVFTSLPKLYSVIFSILEKLYYFFTIFFVATRNTPHASFDWTCRPVGLLVSGIRRLPKWLNPVLKSMDYMTHKRFASVP